MKKVEKEFESLVGKIQPAKQVLRQDVLGSITRSVTVRAAGVFYGRISCGGAV